MSRTRKQRGLKPPRPPLTPEEEDRYRRAAHALGLLIEDALAREDSPWPKAPRQFPT